MRQLNFLLFFALCLGLALFSIENTQTAAINLIPGVQIEAPLSIELLLAVGTGAMLAWIFSLWDQLQRQIESWKAQRELKQQSRKIEELEKTLAELQTETEGEALELEEEPQSTQEETESLSLASAEDMDGDRPEEESESTTDNQAENHENGSSAAPD
ncbi:lipopolysaccharide assembly LapA domain-containing protein [[Limnothrix rosea] IAM M-220]|uniref:LapA family protein n=1 Tax=[Limnothrix rosea] IAM M-220 TaxID=454133 RepID=UPI0009FF0F10|nr:LapA family protein [[Limnothrix rosea] IAM M-220]